MTVTFSLNLLWKQDDYKCAGAGTLDGCCRNLLKDNDIARNSACDGTAYQAGDPSICCPLELHIIISNCSSRFQKCVPKEGEQKSHTTLKQFFITVF